MKKLIKKHFNEVLDHSKAYLNDFVFQSKYALSTAIKLLVILKSLIACILTIMFLPIVIPLAVLFRCYIDNVRNNNRRISIDNMDLNIDLEEVSTSVKSK